MRAIRRAKTAPRVAENLLRLFKGKSYRVKWRSSRESVILNGISAFWFYSSISSPVLRRIGMNYAERCSNMQSFRINIYFFRNPRQRVLCVFRHNFLERWPYTIDNLKKGDINLMICNFYRNLMRRLSTNALSALSIKLETMDFHPEIIFLFRDPTYALSRIPLSFYERNAV